MKKPEKIIDILRVIAGLTVSILLVPAVFFCSLVFTDSEKKLKRFDSWITKIVGTPFWMKNKNEQSKTNKKIPTV